jgi:hypothetical protein
MYDCEIHKKSDLIFEILNSQFFHKIFAALNGAGYLHRVKMSIFNNFGKIGFLKNISLFVCIPKKIVFFGRTKMGCQSFPGTTDQNGDNIPNGHDIYISYGRKMLQMA